MGDEDKEDYYLFSAIAHSVADDAITEMSNTGTKDKRRKAGRGEESW